MKRAALLTLTVALAACQGSIGSTPPIGPPNGVQPNAVGQAAGIGPGGSRAKTSEAIVKYAKDLASIAFPNTEGYGLQIALGSPSPSPSASAKAGASSAAPGKASALAAAKGSPSAGPSASPSASPSPGSSASPAPGASGSSPGPAGSPVGSLSASPSASPSGAPTPVAKRTPAPPITVKLSVYPDLAPVGPTPDPDASPPPTPIADRVPLIRGYFKSPVTLAVGSLDAFRFTVPADELDKTRGYTIALYSVPDKKNIAQSLLGSHKDPSTRLVFTTAAVAEDGGTIHSGTKGDPITLSAGVGYAAILYADPRAVGAAGGALGAPSPLPFNATPLPGGMAQPQPQTSGLPYQYGQTAQPGTPQPISTHY